MGAALKLVYDLLVKSRKEGLLAIEASLIELGQFPIDGRAAMMTRLPGWKPEVRRSSSRKPAGTWGVPLAVSPAALAVYYPAFAMSAAGDTHKCRPRGGECTMRRFTALGALLLVGFLGVAAAAPSAGVGGPGRAGRGVSRLRAAADVDRRRSRDRRPGRRQRPRPRDPATLRRVR